MGLGGVAIAVPPYVIHPKTAVLGRAGGAPALHGKRQGSICHDDKVAYRPLIIW